MTRRNAIAALAGPVLAKAPAYFHKGVNFTAERPNDYSSEYARGMLDSLAKYGVNSIALVPYGFTRQGTPEVRFGGPNVWEREDAIAALSKKAHSLGMRVLLKPQVWVRPGYPGDLDFTSAADRDRWFASYALFVEHFSKLATTIRADLFSVGVEFVKLSTHEQQWRKLIGISRREYSGPLVYSATQGPEFETLRFWDALDYIGLNNYYPLPDDLDASPIVAKVEAVQKRFHKPVIFPEAGFCSYENPHRAPWDETPRKLSLDQQAKCYEAILKAFWSKPWFRGVYWWKIGSNGFGGPNDGSHTPWRKPAMQVLAKYYKQAR